MVETVLFYAASVLAIVFVLVPHEFAHALAAHLNGDYTGWDTEYWDTSSGAPLFKTKTNA